MSKQRVKPSCEQIIDMLPDPFVVIDRNYRIIAANRSYARHYQREPDEVIGHNCYEISHHSKVPCSQHGEHCPLETVFETRQATQVMHIHYDASGREEWVQLSANPIFDDDGIPIYMGEYIQSVQREEDDDPLLIGRSPALMRMISLLQRVAPTQTTVLLQGESGVGKEQVAKYLHRYSERNAGPFVVVDCASLGESLIESELFGHEKGAFTGALREKKGLFEVAHGGTLFIDEIGELPLSLQTKLLRVLETGSLRRIGGTGYIEIDVRVIVATHRNLASMVENRTFRQDLYYRLSAFPVHIPPLRERKDDIALLAEHFLSRLPEGERQLPLTPDVIEALLRNDYPGNVRELRNIIERAVILAGEGSLNASHIRNPKSQGVDTPLSESSATEIPSRISLLEMDSIRHRKQLLHRRGGRLDDDEILGALEKTRGHRLQASQLLGISERTLYRHIRRLRLEE